MDLAKVISAVHTLPDKVTMYESEVHQVLAPTKQFILSLKTLFANTESVINDLEERDPERKEAIRRNISYIKTKTIPKFEEAVHKLKENCTHFEGFRQGITIFVINFYQMYCVAESLSEKEVIRSLKRLFYHIKEVLTVRNKEGDIDSVLNTSQILSESSREKDSIATRSFLGSSLDLMEHSFYITHSLFSGNSKIV